MKKVIEGHLSRKFTVENDWAGDVVHVNVKNTGTLKEIDSRLTNATAVELGETLIKAGQKGVFVFDGQLPSVEKVGTLIREPKSDWGRHIGESTEAVLQDIKGLIAVYNALVKEEAERVQRQAEEAQAALKLKLRRDDLAQMFCDVDRAYYKNCTEATQKAIDYIIEQEEKNK